MPNNMPKMTTPVIMVKNMRLEGTVTVLSISTDRKVVSAEVVRDRPILVTALAARCAPESAAPSVSTKACVMWAEKSTAMPTLITMQVEEMALRLRPVNGTHARMHTSARTTLITAVREGPGGSKRKRTSVTTSAEVKRLMTVSRKVMPTIS